MASSLNPIARETSVLYEISLSIGTSLDIEQMLKHALTKILRGLNCSAALVFAYEEIAGEQISWRVQASIPRTATREINLLEILNLEELPSNTDELESLMTLLTSQSHFLDNKTYYGFKLAGYGFIVLQKHGEEFSHSLYASLTRIMDKLAIACQSCLQEQHLREQMHAAQIANVAKSQFLAMMSHELRTPMNAVIGVLDLLSLSSQQEEASDLIDTAKSSANNLVTILNDILDLSKIEAEKIELESSHFDLSEILDDIVKTFLPTADKKALQIEVCEAPQIPASLLGDSVRIKQIIFNLLGNAIKFTNSDETRAGKVKLSVDIQHTDVDGTMLTIQVKDNGCGISASEQQKLFQPFQQAQLSTTRKFGGTGLGLTICQKLVTLMNGKIWVESEKNKGSTFFVTLPFDIANSPNQITGDLVDFRVSISCVGEIPENTVQLFDDHLTHQGATVERIEFEAIPDKDFVQQDLILLITDFDLFLSKWKLIQSFKIPVGRLHFAVPREYLIKCRSILEQHHVFAINPMTRAYLVKLLKTASEKRQANLALDAELTNDASTKILVVEDNHVNRKLIAKQLKVIGLDCDLASTGKEGLELAKTSNYPIVLTDCHMPEMDGYEMSRKIRKYESEQSLTPLTIIAITGAAMSGDEQLCFEAGMNDFLSKPVHLSKLKTTLHKWLKEIQAV